MPNSQPVLTVVANLGFAAASGLVTAHDALWVIADDDLQLHRFSMQGVHQSRHSLFADRPALPLEPKARKKAKPDLEALCLLPDGRLLALGSGSRRNRTLGSVFDPVTQSTQLIDAAPLYQALEASLSELNIEGACALGDVLVLAHRGNSKGSADALVLVDLNSVVAGIDSGTLPAKARRGLVAVQLGQIDEAPLTLTDLATDGEGRLWFSAAAEVTDNRYDDGPCAGSVIGCFDAAFNVAQQWRVPGHLKIEGLATAGAGRWLLVADADDPVVPSPLLMLEGVQRSR